MKYEEFYSRVISHLEDYNPGDGEFCKRWGKLFKHIVAVPSTSNLDKLVREIISSDGVYPDLYIKPHKYANHLNSSQVVCYEFFRQMMNEDRSPRQELIRFVKTRIGADITERARCYFEYNEPRFGLNGERERTEFDFFITDKYTDVEIFFEIKYTEQEFGPWTKKYATFDNFYNYYAPMIFPCICLKKALSFDDFITYFQLFRNVLRVDSKNRYSVFIFPENNEKVRTHFEEFSDKYLRNVDNVKAIHWEDISEFMSDRFKEKFFNY